MLTVRYTLKTLTLLAVVVLVANLIPTESVDGDLNLAKNDECCAHECDQSAPTEQASTEVPAEEGCCPDNCGSCFLSCCGGPVFLDSPTVVSDLLAVSVSVVSHDGSHLPAGFPGEIDHPPYL